MTKNNLFRFFLLLLCWTALLNCYRETGIEELPVTATQVTAENTDGLGTGSDAAARLGDYVLKNSFLEVVINGQLGDPNRDLYLPHSGGAILDFFSQMERPLSRQIIPRADDGINQVSQGVNMNRGTPIGYRRIEVSQENELAAALILRGVVYDLDGSLAAAGAPVDTVTREVLGCEVVTTLRLTNVFVTIRDNDDGTTTEQSRPVNFLTLTTVMTNTNGTALPIATLNDIAVTNINAADVFVPYPDWGFERPEGGVSAHAYPPYVHILPTQAGTAHYNFMNRVDGVLMVAQEEDTALEAAFTYVGKAMPPTAVLAAGGQLSFVRELLITDATLSGRSGRSAYQAMTQLLEFDLPAESIYASTGTFVTVNDTRGAPGGTFVLEYINQSVRYFDGSVYVNLEEGRRFPIFGDTPIGISYTLTVPVGQLAVSAHALNSEPVFVDVRTDTVDNGDGTTTTTTEPVIVPENDSFFIGIITLGEPHSTISVSAKSDVQRELMARMKFERISGGGPIETGSFPDDREAEFVYLDSTANVTVPLPLGEYEMLVSRGPLHNAVVQSIIVEEPPDTTDGTTDPGPNTPLSTVFNLELSRVVPLSGYLSADFDCRSDEDPLGLISQGQLILFGYAEDLDLFFAANATSQSLTEDIYDALARNFGGFDAEDDRNNVQSLKDEILTARGLAVIGKVGDAFLDRGRFALLNLPDEERVPFLAAPAFESDPAGFFDRVRAAFPDALIHVTRPRAPRGLETGFLTAVAEQAGLAPGSPLAPDTPSLNRNAATGSNTRWLDFDLLQLLSGKDYGQYLQVRQDWFSLLNGGVFKPATGGSAPGSTAKLPLGTVRTWVAVSDTTLRDNDLVEFWSSVRAGNMFVSNGPLIEAQVNNTGYGQQTSAGGNSVLLQLKVSAAPWIPVREVRVVVDGSVQLILPPQPNADIVRFDNTVQIELPPDRSNHWIVIEVGADLQELAAGSGDAGTFGRLYPGHLPLAFTNPIFISGP